MSSNPPGRPQTYEELLAEIRGGFGPSEDRQYPTELPERFRKPRPPKPPPEPTVDERGMLDEVLARARGTFSAEGPDAFGTYYKPTTPPVPVEPGRIQREVEDEIRVGAEQVSKTGGNVEEYVNRMHQLKYGKRIAGLLKAGRDHANRLAREGSSPEEAEAAGIDLAQKHIANLETAIANGEQSAEAEERGAAYQGLIEGFTTRKGLARHALTTGVPMLAAGVVTGPLGWGVIAGMATAAATTTAGVAASQKFIDEQPVDWKTATAEGITNVLPVPVIGSTVKGAISRIANPLARRAVGVLAVGAAEAIEEPVQAIASAAVKGEPIPSPYSLATEAAAGGILGGGIGGSFGLIEQGRQQVSDDTAGATEIEARPPSRAVGRMAEGTADEQLAAIEQALGAARFAGDLPAITSLEGARQTILDARAKGSEPAVPSDPPPPGAAGPVIPPSGPVPPPGAPPAPAGAAAPAPAPGAGPPPGPVGGTSLRPQVPTETAAGEAGDLSAGEAAGQRQAGAAPQVRSLTEQGRAEGQGAAPPPPAGVVRGPTGGTARGVTTTPVVPPARPGAASAPTAAPAAAPGPPGVATAPPVAPQPPTAPPIPPRKLKIGRGANGQVDVVFPDQNHADLFSLQGRLRRASSGEGGPPPDIQGVSARLGIPPDLVGNAAVRYKDAVMEAIRSLPAGETFVAPSLADVFGQPAPTGPPVAPAPAAPAAAPAVGEPTPPEVEPTPGELEESKKRRRVEALASSAEYVRAAWAASAAERESRTEIASVEIDRAELIGADPERVAELRAMLPPASELPAGVTPEEGIGPTTDAAFEPGEPFEVKQVYFPKGPTKPRPIRAVHLLDKDGNVIRQQGVANADEGRALEERWVSEFSLAKRPVERGVVLAEPRKIENLPETFRKPIETALARVPEDARAEVRTHFEHQLERRVLVELRQDDYDRFGREFDDTGQKIKNRAVKRRAAKDALHNATVLYESGWETIAGRLKGHPEASAITARLRQLSEGKGVRQAVAAERPPLSRRAWDGARGFVETHPDAPTIEEAVAKIKEYAKAYPRSFEDVLTGLQRLAGEVSSMSADALRQVIDIPGLGPAKVANALSRGMFGSSGLAHQDFKKIVAYRQEAEAQERAMEELFGEFIDKEFAHPGLRSIADALEEDEASGQADPGEPPLLKTFMWGIVDPSTGEQVEQEAAIDAIRQGHGRLFSRIRTAYQDASEAVESDVPFDIPEGGAAEDDILEAPRKKFDQGPMIPGFMEAVMSTPQKPVSREGKPSPTFADSPLFTQEEEKAAREADEKFKKGQKSLLESRRVEFVSAPQDPFGGRYGPPPKTLTPAQIEARKKWIVKRLGGEGGLQAQRPAGTAVQPEGETAPGVLGDVAGGEGPALGEGAARGGVGRGRGLGVPAGVQGAARQPGEATAAPPGVRQASAAGIFYIINPREVETLKRPPKYELVPEDLNPHLSEEQKLGVAKAIEALQAGSGFLFQDGTGVGKTRELLGLAEKFRREGAKVLILSKASAIEATKLPNGRWVPSGSYADDSAAMGVPIEFTRQRGVPLKAGVITLGTYHNLRDYIVDKDTVLLFDEAHQLKNIGDSEVAASGIDLMRRAKVTGFATATPGDKAYHLGYLAQIGILEGKPYEQAMKDLGLQAKPKKRISKKVYEAALKSELAKGRHPEDAKRIAIEAATEEFMVWKATSPSKHRRAVEALFNRLTEAGTVIKREVDLSPIEVVTVITSLDEDSKRTMDEIEGGKFEKKVMLQHMRRQHEPSKLPKVQELIMQELGRGRQVVVFASRVNRSDVIERGKDQYGQAYERLLATSEGTLKSLAAWLDEQGISYSEIHGEAKESSKEAQFRFQSGNAKVVIATYEKGGTGINLDDRSGAAARTMILMTAPFESTSIVQAIGRVHRFTTRSASRIFMLYSDHSIDKWNAAVIGGKLKQLHAQVSGDINALDLGNTSTDEDALAAGAAHYMDVAAVLAGHGVAGADIPIWSSRHYGKVIHQLKQMGVKIKLTGGDFDIHAHEGYTISGSITKRGGPLGAYATLRWDHDEEAGDLRLQESLKPRPRSRESTATVLGNLSALIRGQKVIKPIVSHKQYDFIKRTLEQMGASWGVTELPGSFQIQTAQGDFFTGELAPPREGGRQTFGKFTDSRDQGAFTWQRLAGEVKLEAPLRRDLGPPARAERRLADVEKAIDRAYKRRRTETAEALEVEADELRTYLEGSQAELEIEDEGWNVEGGEEGAGASIEEQLAAAYARQAGIEHIRSIVQDQEGTGLPELRARAGEITDEELMAAAKDAYDAQTARRERLARPGLALTQGSVIAAQDRWAQQGTESDDPAFEEVGQITGVVGRSTATVRIPTYARPDLPWGSPVRLGQGTMFTRGQEVAGEEGVVVAATQIREGFLSIGKIDWTGLVARTLADVAAIFHTARNPSLEHAVQFFTDQYGRIVGSMQSTSNSPNFVSMGTDFYPRLKARIAEFKAQGIDIRQVYDLHNHPSSDPSPSAKDREHFRNMARELGPLYGGSAVIDHETIAVWTVKGQRYNIKKRIHGFVDPDPFLAEGVSTADFYAGRTQQMTSAVDIRAFSESLLDDGLWKPGSTNISVAFLDNERKTRLVTLVPEAVFLNRDKWMGFVERMGRAASATYVVAATDGGFSRRTQLSPTAINYIEQGSLQEMVDLRTTDSTRGLLEGAGIPIASHFRWRDNHPIRSDHVRLESTLSAIEPAPSAYPAWDKTAPAWWNRRVAYARARTLARGSAAQANVGVDPQAFWDAFVLGVDAVRRGIRRFADWMAALAREIPRFRSWGGRVWEYIRSIGAPVVVEHAGQPRPFGQAVARAEAQGFGTPTTRNLQPIREIPRTSVQQLVKATEDLLAGGPLDMGLGKPVGIGKPGDLAVNVNNVQDEAGIRALMARIVRSLEGKFDLARQKFTNSELHQLALALGYDERDYQRMLKVKGALTAPEIIAGRILRQQAGVDFSHRWATWRDLAARAAERDLAPEETRRRSLEALEAEREKQASLQKLIGMMYATSAAGAEAGRALYAHKLLISTLTPEEQFMQRLLRAGRADVKQMEKLAEALAANDTAAVARILRSIHKPGFTRMVVEYFINSLLSGPPTFVANVTGNVVHEGMRTFERSFAARLEQFGVRQGVEKLLTGEAKPTDRVVGEAMAALKAQVRHKFGILAALDMARLAIAKEDLRFLQAVKGESYVPAIPGLFGRIVRTPGRVMEALDIGAKINAMAAEKAALLWRRAYMEVGRAGVNSTGFRERLQELHDLMNEWIALEDQRITDPISFQSEHGAAGYTFLYRNRDLADIYRQMKQAADVSTFRDEVTRFTGFIKQMRGAYPWLTFVAPFVHTSERILVQGFRRTPVGLLKTAYNIQQGKLEGGEASDRLAQGILGTMTTAAIYMIAADGLLTGGGPEDPKERENWLKTGRLPYAVRIGNRWVSYARIEPIATIFGFAADLAEAKDEKTAGDAFGKLHYAMLNNITNKTYLEGIVSAAEAVGNPDRYMARFWKRSAGAIVPNLLATAARAIDPTIRETDDLSQVLTSRIPILSRDLPARLTGTGEPAQRGETGISRFVSPVRYSDEAGPEKNLERLFLETGYSPAQPPRDITLPGTMGRKVTLSREEREIYGAYARRATDFTRTLAKNGDWTKLDVYAKEEVLKRIYRFAHDSARKAMLTSVLVRLKRGEAEVVKR